MFIRFIPPKGGEPLMLVGELARQGGPWCVGLSDGHFFLAMDVEKFTSTRRGDDDGEG